ncbi:unnamed protein product, partial [Darwinula stevensoni]
MAGACMHDITWTDEILEPCIGENGLVPPYQQCLWNVFGSSPASTIEILLTPEDFGDFSNRSLVLRIGFGYKDDFPSGPDETVLARFDSPVSENTTVIVEGGEAWVDVLTRQEIVPFRIFSTIKNEAFTTTTTTTNPCEGAIGDPCQEHQDCRVNEHLFCNPSLLKCDCADGYIFDTDILMCVTGGKRLGESCSDDSDCNLYNQCDKETKICTCAKGYRLDPKTILS